MAEDSSLKYADKREYAFYRDLLLMLIPPAVMAFYYRGASALRLIAICMLTGVVCELVGSFLMRCPRNLKDCSALFIGAATAMMLPSDIHPWIAICGTAFGVLAVKLPLGGTFSVPFVPVAAGFSFMALCWPDKVFNYTMIGSDGVSGTSLAGMLSINTSIRPNTVNVFDVLIGNVPGPMGASCVIVLLGCAAYMALRHPKSLLNSLGFLAASAAMAVAFPRIYVENKRLISLLLELCSGFTVFAALFFVTDTATSPKRNIYRFFYGLFTGVICMLLRYYGTFEDGVCFAVLIANAVWPAIEEKAEKRRKKRLKKSKTKGETRSPSREEVTEVG
ncbi:MAG: RnfABCDGE type electron transport complex subunit D [Clostridiales bacterium]|nr:RnfABCDGE type electron transport complex subunit D [Clostridiales bacterium]